jgi:hypothetical protein
MGEIRYSFIFFSVGNQERNQDVVPKLIAVEPCISALQTLSSKAQGGGGEASRNPGLGSQNNQGR